MTRTKNKQKIYYSGETHDLTLIRSTTIKGKVATHPGVHRASQMASIEAQRNAMATELPIVQE